MDTYAYLVPSYFKNKHHIIKLYTLSQTPQTGIKHAKSDFSSYYFNNQAKHRVLMFHFKIMIILCL